MTTKSSVIAAWGVVGLYVAGTRHASEPRHERGRTPAAIIGFLPGVTVVPPKPEPKPATLNEIVDEIKRMAPNFPRASKQKPYRSKQKPFYLPPPRGNRFH